MAWLCFLFLNCLWYILDGPSYIQILQYVHTSMKYLATHFHVHKNLRVGYLERLVALASQFCQGPCLRKQQIWLCKKYIKHYAILNDHVMICFKVLKTFIQATKTYPRSPPSFHPQCDDQIQHSNEMIQQ